MEAAAPGQGPLSTARPGRLSRLASAFCVGSLFAFSLGGAAAREGGVLIGQPPVAQVALCVLAGALCFASGVAGLGGFLLSLAALLVGTTSLPGASSLLLFSGRPLLAFALAGAALALAAWGRRPPKWLLLPFFFAAYAWVSYEVQSRVGPDGDEPQYLMVSESLIRDHDLALDQDFKEARYAAFFSRPLSPDFRVRGPQGQIYSLHAVGLSILILPAYWLAGYPGASFFMALLAALLVRELRRLVAAVCGDENLADAVAWLVGLSPPVIHFAGLIFTEIPAALLLCVGLRTSVFGRGSRSLAASSLCASALPWLNVRYSILALAIVAGGAWRLYEDLRSPSRNASKAASALFPAALLFGSAVALAAYHKALWGFFDPRRVYGRRPEFAFDILPEGLPGLFFDQEFGLFVYAPIFVLSLAGFVHLWRRHRALALSGLIAALGVIATASVWPMWRGGFNPPARFLVPLVPILAATLALSLKRGFTPAAALLSGWSLWCGLGGALHMDTVHRDRDGVAPFFRTQSGAAEWTNALPSFVLPEDRATRILALPWAVLLGLPLVGALRTLRGGPIRSRDTLLVSAAFVATAVVADRASPRTRAPERNASRLVGSPSLHLPSLAVSARSEGIWTCDLFYEPHRHPLGFTFANALALPAGRYLVSLIPAEKTSSLPPSLLLRHRLTGRTARSPLIADGEGVHGEFQVVEGEYDLSLIGGEPIAFGKVRLEPVD